MQHPTIRTEEVVDHGKVFILDHTESCRQLFVDGPNIKTERFKALEERVIAQGCCGKHNAKRFTIMIFTNVSAL